MSTSETVNEKFVGKFYGPLEISGIEVDDSIKTPSGGIVFTLSFTNGTTALVPEKALVTIVTDEAKDYNHIREARMNALVPEIMAVIEEYDLPVLEINHICNLIGEQIDARVGRAANWHWTKDDNRFIPGFNAMQEVTVLMTEKVIAEIPKNEQ